MIYPDAFQLGKNFEASHFAGMAVAKNFGLLELKSDMVMEV